MSYPVPACYQRAADQIKRNQRLCVLLVALAGALLIAWVGPQVTTAVVKAQEVSK